MLVVLTRAQDDAARSAEKLAALGHVPVLSPVLQIASAGACWPPGAIDAVLATSARAFECLELAPEWPLPEVRRLLPLFLVGARTLAAASASGFSGRTWVAPDAEALAGMIMAAMKPPGRIAYLAGRDRKRAIETACVAAGLTLEAVETYAALAADRLSEEASHAFSIGTAGAVLHYSRRSADILLALAASAEVDLTAPLHIAISEAAAEPLRAAGLPRVVAAPTPDEASMLALLL